MITFPIYGKNVPNHQPVYIAHLVYHWVNSIHIYILYTYIIYDLCMFMWDISKSFMGWNWLNIYLPVYANANWTAVELLRFHIKNICSSNSTNPMVAWWLRICSPQLYTTGLFQPALQDLFTKGLGCYVHHSGVNRQVPPLYHKIIPSSLAAIDVLIGVIRFSSFGLVGSDM